MKRTKIIATIGPASSDREVLKRMIASGLNVTRLNMSHGTYSDHERNIKTIREVEKETGQAIPIMMDLCGPKIRIGKLKKEPIYLRRGDEIVLTTDPNNQSGIFVNYPNLHKEVKIGEYILLADGAFRLKVRDIRGRNIICTVIVGGPLTSHKGVNLPYSHLLVPAVTKKDKADVEFGIRNGIGIVALSFVRKAEDVNELRSFISEHNTSMFIVSKIEKPEAVENIDSILDASDGIMVARGDLGVEMPIEKVPVIQKTIIKKANASGKPVITATQMLKSMVDFPIPTRAEVTDIANAVLDGTDALMLSEETAVGKYPVKVIEMMSKVAVESEKVYPYKRYTDLPARTLQDSLAKAACNLSREIDVSAIIPFTRTGATAIAVAKYRPPVPILAVTHDLKTCRKLNLVWGIKPFLALAANSTDTIVTESIDVAKKKGMVKSNDKVIILAGAPSGVPGSTNLLKVVDVP